MPHQVDPKRILTLYKPAIRCVVKAISYSEYGVKNSEGAEDNQKGGTLAANVWLRVKHAIHIVDRAFVDGRYWDKRFNLVIKKGRMCALFYSYWISVSIKPDCS